MIRAIVIGDAGPELDEVADALGTTSPIRIVGRLSGRAPVAEAIMRLAPSVTFIQEPYWSPLPSALTREARRAAPDAALIIRAADATPDWVADAMNAGATAVLPATVDASSLGRVVLQIVAEHDSAFEALRLRWAA